MNTGRHWSTEMLIKFMPGTYESPGSDGRFEDLHDILGCMQEADARGQAQAISKSTLS